MRKFGITEETKGSSGVSIPAPTKLASPNPLFKGGYEYPIARLVKVTFNPEKKMKKAGVETTSYVLEFLFKDDKDRQFTHIEFPLDPTSKNAANEPDWQDQRIKHIFEETIGADRLPKEGIGTTAQSEAEYFKMIADCFNSIKMSIANPKAGQEGQPDTVERAVYPRNPVYIKVTYNKTNLQLPLFPNFLQRASLNGVQQPVEKLIIDPKYDKTEPSISASNVPNAAADLSTGLDASFGGTSFEDDLPEFAQ